jgi:hypothetical protein
MTDAWSSFLQALLWFSLWISAIVYFLFRFQELLKFLPQLVKQRLETGASFVVGPVSIGTPPEAMKKGETRGVTSEGVGGIPTSKELAFSLMNRNYPDGFSDEFFLVHSWALSPDSSSTEEKEYTVRLWIESSGTASLEAIKKVTYSLPLHVPPQIVATEARGRNFELWLKLARELNVVAHVERSDRTVVWLNRQLTLPGRPHPLQSLPFEFLMDAEIPGSIDSRPTIINDDKDWLVRVKWEIPALDKNLTGFWKVTLYFEAIIEGISASAASIENIVPLQSTLAPHVYSHAIRVQHDLLPPGLYSMTAIATYQGEDNQPGPMVGMGKQQKLIAIHTRASGDLKHPVEVTTAATLLNKAGRATDSISAMEPSIIRVEWEIESYQGELSGRWEIEAYLQPLGPGEQIKFSQQPVSVDVKSGHGVAMYAEDLHVEPGSVKPGNYRMVVVVRILNQARQPTNVVGCFVDTQAVHFYAEAKS